MTHVILLKTLYVHIIYNRGSHCLAPTVQSVLADQPERQQHEHHFYARSHQQHTGALFPVVTIPIVTEVRHTPGDKTNY